jgi:hypothetical protein
VIVLEMNAVNFAIGEDGAQRLLLFEDPNSKIVVRVPFETAGWETFKRHVAADGHVPGRQVVRATSDAFDWALSVVRR